MNLTANDAIAAQLVMMEAYDIDYGLFDHDALGPTEDPMAVIGMHDGERIWEGSRMLLFMDELISLGLPEKLNMPIDQLMTWPKHILDRYVARYKPVADRERATIDDMEKAQQAALDAAKSHR